LSTQHFVDTGVVVVIGCLSVYVSILRESSMQLLALSEQRATRDGLTGIMNRRAVFDIGNRLAEWRQEIRPPMALMMIDVDHLKELNDTYGHQAGDHVLTAVSDRLSAALRAGDVIGRYGGDEFLAVLIGGDRDDTNRVAERILALMHDSVIPSEGGNHTVTVSIGISDLGPDETDLQLALRWADHALYESKRGGRARFTRD
jgi:diguanylate cyclase (GGDEF)-like protein